MKSPPYSLVAIPCNIQQNMCNEHIITINYVPICLQYYQHHLSRSLTELLRAKAECFARLCHRLGVRPSVSPSVTLVSCIKTVQARITKSSLWAAPRSLVYRDKISCHWVQGFPSNEGVEEGYPLKRRHFAVIGSNNVKTVADRYIHAAYHNKHW